VHENRNCYVGFWNSGHFPGRRATCLTVVIVPAGRAEFKAWKRLRDLRRRMLQSAWCSAKLAPN
jgi:hypothetical protein